MENKRHELIIVIYTNFLKKSIDIKNKLISELIKSMTDNEILELDNFYDNTIYNYIKKNITNFKNKLIYIILCKIPGKDFFNEISSICSDLNVMISTIIYKEKGDEENLLLDCKYYPYTCINDPYLNPGKVLHSTDEIINYIKSIECPYYSEMKIIEENDFIELYEKDNDLSFASEFALINSLEELIYPLIITQYINSTLITKEELDKMQKIFYIKISKIKTFI